MSSFFRYFITCIAAVVLLSGCYLSPVRHLASDVALIKVGESGRDDVLTFLGEPDEQIMLDGGLEKWTYTEYNSSILQDTPLVGKYFGQPDYGTVTVIFKDDIVVKSVYGAFDDDEMDWAKDFDWQEKPK